MARPKVGDDFRTLAMGRVVAHLSQFDPLILEVTPLAVRTRMHFGRKSFTGGFWRIFLARRGRAVCSRSRFGALLINPRVTKRVSNSKNSACPATCLRCIFTPLASIYFEFFFFIWASGDAASDHFRAQRSSA